MLQIMEDFVTKIPRGFYFEFFLKFLLSGDSKKGSSRIMNPLDKENVYTFNTSQTYYIQARRFNVPLDSNYIMYCKAWNIKNTGRVILVNIVPKYLKFTF